MNRVSDGADYEYLHCYCQHEVGQRIGNSIEAADCGEIAVARVWWQGPELDSMLVCQKHLDNILASEGDDAPES